MTRGWTHKRRWMLALFLGLAAFRVCAQERAINVDSVPVEILVSPDSVATLRTDARRSDVGIAGEWPATIPIFTILEDGTRVAGVRARQDEPQPLRQKWPSRVVLQGNGEWSLSYSYFAVACGKLRPGATIVIPGSESARVCDSWPPKKPTLSDQAENRRSSMTITTHYNHFGAAAQLTENDVRLAINNAVAEYTQILSNNSASLDLYIQWDGAFGAPILDHDALAATFYTLSGVSYPFAHSLLFDSAVENTDIDDWEPDLAGHMPTGPSVPYLWSFGLRNASSVLFSESVFEALTGIPPSNGVLILLNDTFFWNALGRYEDLSIVDAAAYDLEGTLVHEIGHARGFVSWTGGAEEDPFDFSMTSLDLFRFPYTTSAQSFVQFSMGARQLSIGERATAVLGLFDSGSLFEMANGSNSGSAGGQPGHWPTNGVTSGSYVGIMESNSLQGRSLLKNGSYVQLPDVRALDVLGWKIRPSNLPGVATPGTPTAPSGGSVVHGAPYLTWTPGSQQSQAVGIVDFGPTAASRASFAPQTAYLNINLGSSDNSLLVPGAYLNPGHSYEWYIASSTTRGSVFSSYAAFETDESFCKFDLTNDGLVEDADFSLFVVQYDELDCASAEMPNNCIGDFNLDGLVDDLDFSLLVVAYNNLGCT
ncbi:MAG: NF038122 family metalloprotease [Planctomycetes bacterium]|nr:NF038122 family metalloprotease [Planctomycetota bacterium]